MKQSKANGPKYIYKKIKLNKMLRNDLRKTKFQKA